MWRINPKSSHGRPVAPDDEASSSGESEIWRQNQALLVLVVIFWWRWEGEAPIPDKNRARSELVRRTLRTSISRDECAIPPKHDHAASAVTTNVVAMFVERLGT